MKQPVTYEQHLRVKLSESEIAERERQAGDCQIEADSLESELEQIRKSLKSQIEQQQNRMAILLDACRQGYEVRPVQVERQFNRPEKGMKQVVRLDTFEVIEGPYRMTSDELQEDLPLEGDE